MTTDSNDRYQYLFRRMPIMTAALDGRGYFIDQSDALIDKLGYSREELIKLRPVDIADAASIDRIENEMLPQLRRTGAVRDVPVVFVTKKGEPLRLRTSALVECDPDGLYVRTLAIYHDVDEAAQLEIRFQEMYRATPAMLHTVDANGVITNVSEHWLHKLGYERRDVLGVSIMDFMSDKIRDQLGGQQALKHLIAGGDLRNEDRQMVTRDGQVLELVMSSVSERNAAGEVTRMLVASKDVTERNVAERKLRESLAENARLRNELEQERDYLREEFNVSLRFGQVVGDSPALQAMLASIAAVAATPASVLILGESGVGKELVARELHAASPRAAQPLVKVNCASIPVELFESEFFGHVKGAFTGAHRDRIGRFQLADGGTIFLDEVGEIPLDLQGKLLRVLQENEFERVGDDATRKVDVRVIAATNRDLQRAVAEGAFREDLYYRLSVFPLQVPPLRERGDDVITLAQHFLRQTAKDFGRAELHITQAQAMTLRAYPWPGNVRELKNVIERAVILSTGTSLRLDLSLPADDDALPVNVAGVPDLADTQAQTDVLTDAQMRELARKNALRALQLTGWRVSGEQGAAQLLGVKPTTLSDRIRAWGLRKPAERSQ